MLLSIALAMASVTTSFNVSGVQVILRQNNANNVVAANLYLLGGARQVTDGNAGIEPILLDVSERGTQRYPKNALRRAMSRLGSEIVVAPSADWTMFGIRSSTEVFDSTWAIFADRVMRPTLAKSEVSLVKAQYLSGIRQRRDDPDALAGYLADSITFVGHPYAVSVGGNERSLQAVDSATLRDYHRTQLVTSRMLLVVVGNIDRAHIERLVSQSIGQLPAGSYKWTAPPRVPELQDSARYRTPPAPDQLHTGLLQRSTRKRPGLPGAAGSYVGADGKDVRGNSYSPESHVRRSRSVRRSCGDRGRALCLDSGTRYNSQADARRDHRSSAGHARSGGIEAAGRAVHHGILPRQRNQCRSGGLPGAIGAV